ncbi:dephospho-CoA kinase [Caldicellulosiruptor saccharolyticus DSM 8903]|uniref:Dephospho-CoA kinase n=1 Tax=Caldicellulosiruptor saccharolyticus (strain ATCC 43494 / DSM 8903 / Tp8T 6331) TaxID=351627 RepID=A4XKY7_CALS8|nr:dephospho-CoA kinase [Caldicellulosiruptor saccharolyticus]ABP67572.1 dephospho-CoA kinase [Caldicellulosiruptor saccharolyticus DSM 8903]
MKQSKVLGITGKIGSGKSTVSKILKEHYGFEVIDADKEYHWLLQNSLELKLKLTQTFGEEILTDAKIDRVKLRKVALKCDFNMELLNKITHPFIFERVNFLITDVYKDKHIVIDAALLFQIGLNKLCSIVWYVECEKEILIERVIRRSGYDVEEVEKFLERQRNIERYKDFASRIVINNGSIEDLKALIEKYLKEDGLI